MDKRQAELKAQRRVERALERPWKATKAQKRRGRRTEGWVVEVRSTAKGTEYKRVRVR